MNDFAARLTVESLFGYLDHTVDFRTEDGAITILTGANGSGKTHVLKILRSLVSFDYMSFGRFPCQRAELQYVSSKQLEFAQVDDDVVRLSGRLPTRELGEILLRIPPDPFEDTLPEYIDRLDDDVWVDVRDGEMMSSAVVRSRYGGRQTRTRPGVEVLGNPDAPLEEWIAAFRAAAPPTIVETQRLDLRVPPYQDHQRSGLSRGPTSRVRQYVDQIIDQVAAARRASLEASQRADRQFAARALDRARFTVREPELRRNYQVLAEFNQRLNGNGLTEASAGVEFPGGRTNPTERRIISVFLEDWASKLQPLEAVHNKIELLRAVVDTKLLDKQLSFDNGQVSFVNTVTSQPISVERLSSGEQHLLALFTMLIFSAAPGTLVLVDEPEISLHAAWKHAFLSDIREVAKLNDLQVVLATHSSGIIHGEWDLAEELSLGLPQGNQVSND
jgi:ABC-type transport system involved in cytochrome c biogenesis ATPase subunit